MSFQQMQDIDIRTVDIDTLPDINKVNVDMNLPKQQRMLDVVRQMGGNPYLFRDGNIIVKVSYSDTTVTLDSRIESYLRTL